MMIQQRKKLTSLVEKLEITAKVTDSQIKRKQHYERNHFLICCCCFTRSAILERFWKTKETNVVPSSGQG